MSFHCSAQNIECHGHILKAELANGDGEHHWTECNLNDWIGNNDGRFEWGGQGTSFTSRPRLPSALFLRSCSPTSS